ncbi:hypothetical protein PM082_015069 [Marasmius tenuissimus]|nr:hypothetical protein PM082_015069 [Marasmius tenuissimus]
MESSLPPGGKPLCFIFYSDKSKLSSFGTTKGYPIVARIANIDDGIHNSNIHTGGGRVVGWLDVVPDDKLYPNNKAYTAFKRVVYHCQVTEVLKSVRNASFTGIWYRFGPGTSKLEHQLFPCIPVNSADYEEQGMITHTKGSNGNFPCPVCLVPNEKQSDHYCRYPLRTAAESKRALGDAELANNLGIRQLENVFWAVNNSDPHQATSYDCLHAAVGLFEHLRKAAFARIEDQGSKVMILFTDGSKKEDVTKQFPFCLHNILTKEVDQAGYKLVQCMHAFRRFKMYASLTLHTSETLERGRAAALSLSEHIQVLCIDHQFYVAGIIHQGIEDMEAEKERRAIGEGVGDNVPTAEGPGTKLSDEHDVDEGVRFKVPVKR